jgi:hypothetical protein
MQNCDNFIIRDSEFYDLGDGTTNVYGFSVKNSSNGLVENCVFRDVDALAIGRLLYFGDTAPENSQHNSVLRNEFRNVSPAGDGDAIVVQNDFKDSYITISENSFTDCAKRYVKLQCNYGLVSNNIGDAATLTAPMSSCVSVFGSGFTVRDNTFNFNVALNSCQEGISLSANSLTGNVTDLTVENNQILSHGSGGSTRAVGFESLLESYTDVSVTGNTVTGFSTFLSLANLSVAPMTRVLISDNHITGIGTNVIHTQGGAMVSLVVSNNISTTQTGFGGLIAITGTAAAIDRPSVSVFNNSIPGPGYITNRVGTAFNNMISTTLDPDLSSYRHNLRYGFETSDPTTGTARAHLVGDYVSNTNTTLGAPTGWVCTVAGTPGTWSVAGIAGLVAPITALADEATPTVAGGSIFVTSGTANDPITDFDDGVLGQTITVLSEHAVTITDGTNIILHGSANFVMAASDSLTLVLKADNKWYETARMVNLP